VGCSRVAGHGRGAGKTRIVTPYTHVVHHADIMLQVPAIMVVLAANMYDSSLLVTGSSATGTSEGTAAGGSTEAASKNSKK
jgi:hypothetical protein